MKANQGFRIELQVMPFNISGMTCAACGGHLLPMHTLYLNEVATIVCGECASKVSQAVGAIVLSPVARPDGAMILRSK